MRQRELKSEVAESIPLEIITIMESLSVPKEYGSNMKNFPVWQCLDQWEIKSHTVWV
jgi:hypothetical protein